MSDEMIYRDGGRIEVHRTESDRVQVSLFDEDGGFSWFTLSEDGARDLSQRIMAVAIRAVDYA